MASAYKGEKITFGQTSDRDYIAIYKGDELVEYYHEPGIVDFCHKLGIPYDTFDLEGDGLPDIDQDHPPDSLKECRKWLKERRRELIEEKKRELQGKIAELEKELANE